MDEPLYYMTVESNWNRRQLIAVTGERSTVVEMALRVIVDAAPVWQDAHMVTPMFSVNVQKVK